MCGFVYPAACFIIPQSHLQHLGREGIGLLFGVTGGDGGKDQNALANGRDYLLLDSYRSG